MRKPKNFKIMVDLIKEGYEDSEMIPIEFYYLGDSEEEGHLVLSVAVAKDDGELCYFIDEVDKSCTDSDEKISFNSDQFDVLKKLNINIDPKSVGLLYAK